MRYMLLIHEDETRYSRISPEENGEMLAEYARFAAEAREARVYVDSARLRPTSTATSVRLEDGRTLTTDGPFAETKEQLGGFILVDVPDLDQAIQWAARIPAARNGWVEVRPIWEQGTTDDRSQEQTR